MTDSDLGPALSADDDVCPHCSAAVEGSWLVCAWCGDALAAAAELPTGAALADDRFVVESVLGRGGFGITYAVRDTRLQRQVAIKELFPESAVRHGATVLTPPHARLAFRDARTRFLGEARVLARFSHPAIVRVFEVFEEHGTAYLVMELLDGRNLSKLLAGRGQPFTEAEVLDVAARVGGALTVVHESGVLHRDLNPSNIVLTDHGRLVLIDFGIARSFEQGTQSFTRVVTPGYAPPEQYVGSARFGPPTDVYGLAAALYRLATGAMPLAAVDRQAGGALAAPHRLVPGIGKDVSDALLDGLELVPEHRPQTIAAFLARLGIDQAPTSNRSLLIDGFPPASGPVPPAVDPAVPAPQPLAPLVASPAGAAADPPTVLPVDPSPDDPPTMLPVDPPTMLPVDPPTAVPSEHRPPPPTAAPKPPPPAPGPEAEPWPAAEEPEPWIEPVAALRPVGPHPRIRRWVLLPLAVTTAAVASAAPLVIVPLLVLVILPALATVGDVVVHRFHIDHGQAESWFARSGEAVVVPARFFANVATSLVRAVPALATGALLVGVWSLVHGADVPTALDESVLRLAGAVTAGVLLYPAGHGSRRFRTDLGTEAVVDAVTTEDGRLDQRGYVLWVVCIALVAACLWLHPDPWPLHG